jgi:CDP-6-deoxy-D-xylo-4-hexulose-3-dehydrase
MEDSDQLRAKILDLVAEYGSSKSNVQNVFLPGETPVPVSGKVLDSHDYVSLVEASLDGWLTAGRFHTEFQRRLAQYVGVRNSVFVNSGSSANQAGTPARR